QRGVAIDALVNSDNNVLMHIENGTTLFVSESDGNNTTFNVAFTDLNPAAFGPTMMINLPAYFDSSGKSQDRIYVAAANGRGIAYQDYNGHVDSIWLYPQDDQLGNKVTSFARQANGTVVAFDNDSRGLWIKQNYTTPWTSK